MKKLIVDKKFDNKKLNSFIQYNFKDLSMNTLYKALRKKDIKVNGKRVSQNVTVFVNDEIEIYISDELLYNTLKLEKVYEDENIVIINKPDNIEILGNDSITSILEKEYNFIKPCHRLDRNTKGLVVFAKNEKALQILLDKFKNHEIEKHYICHVYGIPEKKEATLKAYLFKDSAKSIVYIKDTKSKGYQEIITSYRIIKENEDNTAFLDVNLHTGRTHQIRAHLAYIGYPIIGDRKIWNK